MLGRVVRYITQYYKWSFLIVILGILGSSLVTRRGSLFMPVSYTHLDVYKRQGLRSYLKRFYRNLPGLISQSFYRMRCRFCTAKCHNVYPLSFLLFFSYFFCVFIIICQISYFNLLIFIFLLNIIKLIVINVLKKAGEYYGFETN